MDILTSKGTFIIREETPADLHQLVHVHVTSWNATYPNYHPKPTPEMLDEKGVFRGGYGWKNIKPLLKF